MADFKEWYDKNKERLSDARKKKYQDDPEYREKVLARVAAYRKKHRPKNPRPRGRPPGPVEVEVEVGGRKIKAYSVSRLAEEISRSVETINAWERAGRLPETPLRSSAGDRLYTEAMIFAVKLALSKRGKIRADDGFADEIRDRWQAQGITCK